MRQTDDEQNQHPSVEDSEAVCASLHSVRDYDVESDAEENREYCVELAVYEQILQASYNGIERVCLHFHLRFVVEECPERKLRKVGEGYAKQGKSSEGIERNDAVLYGLRCVFGFHTE